MKLAINKPKEPHQWEKSHRFSNSDEAISKIEKSFPNLKCPVCFSSTFDLVDDYENDHRTGMLGYVFPQAVPAVVNLLISLNCSRCGYLISFDEEKVAKFEASE